MFLKKRINNVLYKTALLVALSSCGTHSHMQTDLAVRQDTVVTDKDGKRYPVKEMTKGTMWMTANLDWNIPDSYCYNNASENCTAYGRLYTWKVATQVCSMLGEGWRLPAIADWQALTKTYTGSVSDSNVMRKEAYRALLISGGSGFNAVLGGGRNPDGQYARIDAHGFYWTATEIDDSTAWSYNFAKGSQSLYQQNGGEKSRAFSVRCVKDLARSK